MRTKPYMSIETVNGLKDTVASIELRKDEALALLQSVVAYKRKPSLNDMQKLRRVMKLIEGIAT